MPVNKEIDQTYMGMVVPATCNELCVWVSPKLVKYQCPGKSDVVLLRKYRSGVFKALLLQSQENGGLQKLAGGCPLLLPEGAVPKKIL